MMKTVHHIIDGENFVKAARSQTGCITDEQARSIHFGGAMTLVRLLIERVLRS